MMTLCLREGGDQVFLARAASRLQRVTGVLRVRTDPALCQLEIVFRQPTDNLLRSVHEALRSLREDPLAVETC